MQQGARSLDNDAPLIHSSASTNTQRTQADIEREYAHPDEADPIDALEVYDLIKGIRDPEHPNTLEQLRVVNVEHVYVDEPKRRVKVQFTPTVPHCSMTTLIGLCILVKLQRTLPQDYRVKVLVTPGSHQDEVAVCKQLADKERVCAALESKPLLGAVESCLRGI